MHRKHGWVAASLSNRIHPPLHSVILCTLWSEKVFNHGMHRKHGLVAASLSNSIYPPLHSVYSGAPGQDWLLY